MSTIRRIVSYMAADCWTIGFIEQPLSSIVSGKSYIVHYLQHQYKDRWFADPWLLDVDDATITVLVEEYRYSEKCGYISKLTVDRTTFKLIETIPLLKLSSHLSFPAILREGDVIYVYPENAAGEGLGLYELSTDDSLCHVRTLSKLPLADAVINNLFGETLMFCTMCPNHNGNTLSIHKIDVKTGESRLLEKHAFDSNVARNAGEWFKIDDKIYRPAQDCNGGYGMAVIIQEVCRNLDGSFEFQDVCRLTSAHKRFNTGLHTFNHCKGLSVIDVHGFRYPKVVAKTSLRMLDTLVNIRQSLTKK